MDLLTIGLVVVVVVAVFLFVLQRSQQPPPPPPTKYHLGDVTLESLRFYAGYDWSKPILFAVKGKVYNISDKHEVYGPGKPKEKYAGREVARALALDSLDEQDFSDDLAGLSAEQLQRLDERVAELEKEGCDVVGQVVPLREFSAAELALHDGSDPTKPLYLSIRGTVYDITKGKDWYGPDGVYPFAGKEVARAFALFSTELSDCNDNLEGLNYTEKENLREWTGKFNSKYPIVGKLVR